MTLCQCGCGHEVKPGNRYINGHNGKNKKLSEETRERMSEAKKGHIVSEETRKKLSEINKGFKHPNFIHGKYSLLNQQQQYRKEECLFGCEKVKRYDLHHEPELEDILTWEGQLINLCRSCHKRVHDKTLKLPDNARILWTKEDTEKIIKEKF